jgi:hypothetical protein
MNLLLPVDYDRGYHGSNEGWKFLQVIKFFKGLRESLGSEEKLLNELAPAQVTE